MEPWVNLKKYQERVKLFCYLFRNCSLIRTKGSSTVINSRTKYVKAFAFTYLSLTPCFLVNLSKSLLLQLSLAIQPKLCSKLANFLSIGGHKISEDNLGQYQRIIFIGRGYSRLIYKAA